MIETPFRYWRVAIRSLCVVIFAGCFHVSAGASEAAALNACFPAFAAGSAYDTGQQSAVSIHASGLIVEFHESHIAEGALWYRVGKLYGERVNWGPPQNAGVTGSWPSVVITKEGYVIAVHANLETNRNCNLYYRVGHLQPGGDEYQRIMWKTDFLFWDAGFKPSIAINDRGVIVGVHEAGRGGDGVYYRVGHLRNPAGGDFTIEWDSPAWGIRYDTGEKPNIALNNHGEVVAVHQVPNESILHCRRGLVVGGTIHFTESERYDDHGTAPAVALLDNGLVMEMHDSGAGTIARLGRLNLGVAIIDWSDQLEVGPNLGCHDPAVATNGIHVIHTNTIRPAPYRQELYASVAEVCQVPE